MRRDGTVLHGRAGPFWDAGAGRAPRPRAAATLGLEVLDVDVDQDTVELAFTATDDFTTPRGDVLEGFLAAMFHDTVGPALIATLGLASSSRRSSSGLSAMAAAEAALRRVREHPRPRPLEDDESAAPKAPGADPHARQHRPEAPGGRRSGIQARFGERALALVRGYKRDLDRNETALRAIQQELARRGYQLTETRILDLLIWSAAAST
jgi:hypothetical protein